MSAADKKYSASPKGIATRKRASIKHRESRKTNPAAFLRRSYNGMQSRVRDKPSYIGKELLPLDAFIEFGLRSIVFCTLYLDWQAAGCPLRSVTPTPDRIDNSGGYTLDNMQWLTFDKNNRKQ